MGLFDGLFGGRKNTQPGNADKDKGMADYLDAIKDYERDGNNQYSWLEDLVLANQGDTGLKNITTDPALKAKEMAALADLEQISKDGLSMRDQADLARLEGQVNRQNAGRIGAIQQNMAARGMAGSGLELVSQQQAAQDATERQALASLEKAAMAQEGRRSAMQQMGQMAGNMSARDWQQQAQAAAAQDAINRFNVTNQNQATQYNNAGRQGTANQNVAQNNQFQQNILGAKQGGAQMTYNNGVDKNNQRTMQNQRGGVKGAIGGALSGAAAGSTLGVPGMVGGAMLGAVAGGMYEGGKVPGQAQVPGDHPANDTVPAMLSPGEVVIPRSVVQAAEKDHASDAIDNLLKAMAAMQKRGK